jgi:GNAT superfamily N-acetyltransferase
MKTMHIRPANEASDLNVIQRLYDASYPEPIPNAHQVVKNAQVRVAQADDGEVIGFRMLSPYKTVWVAVVAEYRRRGIGRLLMEDALEQAFALGLTELTSRLLDSEVAGNAFCERFKFKPFVHAVNLALDLTTWDQSVLSPKLDQAQQNSIQFVTFAELGDNPANRHKLYSLNKTLAATIPRDQPQEFIDFETYVARRVDNNTMPHGGIYIAVEGDQWVGMSQMSLEEDHAFQQMTGVLPDYRERGIAQALKFLVIRFAAQNNQTIVRTFNDVGNQPMIAVNESAGFRQGQRFYLVRRKPLSDVQ